MRLSYQQLTDRHARDRKILRYWENARHRQQRAERERPALIADAMSAIRGIDTTQAKEVG